MIFVIAFLLCPPFSPTPILHADTAPVVVALGDSLTLGTGSTSGNDWVSLVSRWSGISIINKARSGDTTGEALARVATDVLPYNPDLVIVFLGGNDTLQQVPIETTINNLKEIVIKIQESGGKVMLVATHRDVLQYDVESRIQMLANETDSYYVSRAMRGVLGVPENLSDPVHPNDKGYRIVAEHIWEELAPALNELFPTAPLRAMCEAEKTSALINTSVPWKAFVWGGTAPRTYSYEWSGSENSTSASNMLYMFYQETGTKTASVRVTSGAGGPVQIACRNSVTVTAPPLAGYCTVDIGTKLYKGERDAEIIWNAVGAGGTGVYAYKWQGENVNGTEQTARASFSTTGTKSATVTITSGNESLALTCSAQVRGFMLESNENNPLSGSCAISPGTFSIQNEVTWYANARGENGVYSYEWSGSPKLSGDEQSVKKKYNTTGIKTGEVKIRSDDRSFSLSCQIRVASEPVSGGGGGCFIATAAYGSAWDRPVRILRDFRDEILLQSRLGRGFVALYYEVSPPLADAISKNETAKYLVRLILSPIVWLAERAV